MILTHVVLYNLFIRINLIFLLFLLYFLIVFVRMNNILAEDFMNPSTRKYVIPVFIIVLIAIFGLSSTLTVSLNSNIENAKLDLSSWQSDEFLLLNGEWEYFPNALKDDISGTGELVTIPHDWEPSSEYANKPYGYATYRLEISGLNPEYSYSFYLDDLGMAYNLFVNDQLIMYNGVTSKDENLFVPESKSTVGIFYPDENGSAIVIVEIANFNYFKAGFWNTLQIGDQRSITSEHHERLLVESFIGWMVCCTWTFLHLVELSFQSRKKITSFRNFFIVDRT